VECGRVHELDEAVAVEACPIVEGIAAARRDPSPCNTIGFFVPNRAVRIPGCIVRFGLPVGEGGQYDVIVLQKRLGMCTRKRI
jgi:hypothetical protein